MIIIKTRFFFETKALFSVCVCVCIVFVERKIIMILVHKLKLKGKGHQQEQEKTTLHINPKNKCIHIVGRTDTCRITKLENLPSKSTMWFNIYYRLQ